MKYYMMFLIVFFVSIVFYICLKLTLNEPLTLTPTPLTQNVSTVTLTPTSWMNNVLKMITTQPFKDINSDEKERNDLDVVFIMLTNDGYLEYTLNCIESLRRIGSLLKVKCYCIGEKSYNILKKNGVNVISLDSNLLEFEKFYGKNWTNMMYVKLKIIYDNLLNHDYVLYADGDIVFEKREFYNYILNIIEDKNVDLICQNDYGVDSICAGFMLIKSNPVTLKLFNAHTNVIEGVTYICNKEEDIKEKDDQSYIDRYLKSDGNIKVKKLSNILFPNGKFYYENVDKIEPYIIHFNWVVGDEKKNLMKKYGKMYKVLEK